MNVPEAWVHPWHVLFDVAAAKQGCLSKKGKERPKKGKESQRKSKIQQ
jgi:hypothetical protein